MGIYDYNKEAVMPMEFIVSSVHVAVITNISDSGTIEEI